VADNTVKYRAVLDDRVSSGLDRLRDKFDRLGGKGSSASFFGNVTAMAVAKGFDLIGDAASSAIDFVQDSIQAASNLNESQNKSRVIFGDSANAIEEWASGASDSFGQSERAALDAASTFAGLFDTAGISLGDATDMSKKLTVLGSDLASFFNTDVSDALAAVRSGLAGESEPLRRFNVFLSETAVSAKLVEMGQKKVNGQWTEGQKIAARYQIILEQTDAAQGDFAATADGLANSQKTVNAKLEDAQALLGQKMLPAQLAVTNAQIDFIEGLTVLNDWLTISSNETAAYDEAVRRLGGRMGQFEGHLMSAEALQIIVTKEWEKGAQAGLVYGQSVVTTADDVRESGVIMQGSIRKVATTTKDASDDAIAALDDFEDAWGDLRSALTGSASSFADSVWDPILLKGEIAANELEQKQLRMVRDNKDAGVQERRDAEQRINELQKTRIEQLAELASYGDQSARSALLNELKILETTRDMTDEQKAKLAQLRKALGLTATSWNGVYAAANKVRSINPYQWGLKFLSPKASGGPVEADGAYIVGEQGPELFVPDTSGNIIPNGGTMSLSASRPDWGGGTPAAPITFVYSPTYSTASPAEAQRFMRAIVPELTRELRRQRLA
jgi:hypothetical protein